MGGSHLQGGLGLCLRRRPGLVASGDFGPDALRAGGLARVLEYDLVEEALAEGGYDHP